MRPDDHRQKGINDLSNIAGPLSGFLYGGQIDSLKAQFAEEQAAYNKATSAGITSNQKNTTPLIFAQMLLELKLLNKSGYVNANLADQTTKSLLGRSQGSSVQTLSGAIKVWSAGEAGTGTGRHKDRAADPPDITQLQSRLERVEASRRAMLERVGGQIEAVLRSGFAAVTGAVSGLPSYFGTAAAQGRGTSTGGRRTTAASDPKAGHEGQNRGHNVINFRITTDYRSNTGAAAVGSRYGPTPGTAGAV